MSITSNRLKEIRGKRSQEEVANGIGISRARLSHYENDRSEADYQTLKKIADYYGVTTDYLLGNSDNPKLSADEEFQVFKNNPKLQRFYEELPESDEEDVEKLRDMWEIIKRKKN